VLKGIVFDMDGVIVDSHPVHRRAWQNFLVTLGKEMPEQELDFILDGRKREEILRHFLGELTAEQIAEYGNRKDEMLRKFEPDVAPIPGVIQFLQTLSSANLKIALATSATSERTLGTLQRLGIAPHFTVVVTGNDVIHGKPDPAIYRLAAERLDVMPRDLLAFEDAVSGICSAKTAGMKCFAIATNGRTRELLAAGADYAVPNFLSLSLTRLKALWARLEQRRAPLVQTAGQD
jgi:HAD superfamily hydrolase (TIGR01509 family)